MKVLELFKSAHANLLFAKIRQINSTFENSNQSKKDREEKTEYKKYSRLVVNL